MSTFTDPLRRLRCFMLRPGLRLALHEPGAGDAGAENGAGGSGTAAGASSNSEQQTTGADQAQQQDELDDDDLDDDPEGAEQLGDAGKKALDKMKADKIAAKRDARAAAARAAAAEAKNAELQAKIDGREAEHQAEQDRARVESDALAQAHTLIKKAEVRALAAGKLTDPEDALVFLDLEEFEVDQDGAVDRAQIEDAIGDLLSARPYLAAEGQSRFPGGADNGADKGARNPRQLTASDIEKMTPAEVDAARRNGQLKNLMTGKR
ncbi:MAG: hypothetical protein D3X82_16850 [Candidatus Leucobacter sulfamidivorax]|nr:hypothetical protein [Candidatus Leucobacter sulfamidivorax]